MFEQSDIHPYRRTVEEKNGVSFFDQLKKIGIFFKVFFSVPFVLYAIASFLLARAQILGALYPFALAFIAAQALRDRKYALYSLFGALVAIPFTVQSFEMVVQAGAYSILATLVYFYPSINKRLMVFPILAAAINIVVKGMAASFLDGSSYNAMVILFESMLAGGLTPVLYVALRAEPWAKDGEKLTAEEYVCFLLLVMALIMGVGDLSYQFITVKGIISRYCILLAAWMGGPGAGAAIGALVGIIPSLSNMVAPSIVGNFAFSGLLAGAFKTFSKLGVIIGFILANMLLSIYYLNQPAVLGSLAECLIAAALLVFTPYKIYHRLGILEEEAAGNTNKKEEISLREVTATRLREVSEIFNDIAGSFNQAACEEKVDEDEINRIFNNVSQQVCHDCAIHKICWEHDKAKTCKSILELFNLMDTKGFINIKHVNPSIKKRCSRLREMVATISCMYDNYRLDAYWRKKFAENRELISAQMRGMAGILQNLSGEVSGSIKVKHMIQNNLSREFEKQGLHVDKLCVEAYSDKSTQITFEKDTCHGLFDCPKIISNAISKISGREFAVFDGVCSLEEETKNCKFRLVPRGNLRIAHTARQITKEGNVISGDTVQTTMLKDGKQLLLLSDGMGSGPIAASESKHTVMLLEKLLETGFDKDTALKSVNAVLLGKHGRESFATVDLVVIDLYSTETDFVKVSAPASFIKRGAKVITIKAENPPIGIVNSFEVETISQKLNKHDFVIMLTDGVLEAVPAFNKEEWIADRIRELDVANPDELADMLLNKIIVSANGKIKDDMTILVAFLY